MSFTRIGLMRFTPFFDKPADQGGGDPPDPSKKPDSKPGDPPEGKKDDAKNGDGDGDKKFTQADIDRIVTERLERASKKAEKDAEKLKSEAEEKALAEQKKFETLAEKRQTRITELEGEAATLKAEGEKTKRYEAALTKYRDAEAVSVPDHLKPLLEKLDVVEQIEWLAANKATLIAQPDPKKPIPPTPPPANGKELDEAAKKKASETTARQYQNRF